MRERCQKGTGCCRYVEGEATYEVAFVDTQVERMEHTLEGEPPVRQVADLRTGARVLGEVCRVKLALPTPSPARLRWLDEGGQVVVIEQRWGLGQRNMRNLYAMPDGTFDGTVTTGRYRLGRPVGDWVTRDREGGVVSRVAHVDVGLDAYKVGFGKVKGRFLVESGGTSGVEVNVVMAYSGMGL